MANQPLTLTLTNAGKSYVLDLTRLEGGVFASTPKAYLTAVNTQLNTLNPLTVNVVPFAPAVVANGGTVALVIQASSEGRQVLRPTGDTTIAGAVINLPTTGLVDGAMLALSTTGTITTVTGTLQSGSVLPAVSTLVAGTVLKLRYNLAATTWFKV